VPLWWWLPALIGIGLIYLDLRIGHPNWPAWPVAAVLVIAVGFAFHRLGRTRVTVSEQPKGQLTLRVGPASLPTRFIAGCEVIAAKDKQPVLGPGLDPAAYLMHRPWVRGLVRVTLNDPADPTPYWLFSVRHAEALIALLRAPHPG
jgi:hypothetical protein